MNLFLFIPKKEQISTFDTCSPTSCVFFSATDPEPAALTPLRIFPSILHDSLDVAADDFLNLISEKTRSINPLLIYLGLCMHKCC